MRVVLDTNVLVSAFLYGGVPLEVVSLAESGVIEAATSNEAFMHVHGWWIVGRDLRASEDR